MRGPRLFRDVQGVIHIERFRPSRRVEHLIVIATFVLLVLTGLPQKFYGAGWSATLLAMFGGLETARWFHRVAGLLFSFHLVVHLTGAAASVISHRGRPVMVPVVQDLWDAWNNLQWYLGFRPAPPELPVFDYRQKFEYLGMVMGGAVMVISGIVLFFPIPVASILPGEFIPAARMAHSNEAMLALLVLVIWHVYGSHLSPEVFPMDTSIFTGYMTLEELQERHALEYRRLFPDGERSVEELVELAESERGTAADGDADAESAAVRQPSRPEPLLPAERR